MIIKNFNIGDKIAGTLLCNEDFSYKDTEYTFSKQDEGLVLEIAEKSIEVSYDDNDMSSRNFITKFNEQKNPIVKIIRKYKNKIFVELYVYQELRVVNDLILYYGPEVPRMLESLRVTSNIFKFFRDEFILKDNIFATESKNGDLLIIGDDYEIKAIFVNNSTIKIERILNKHNRNYNFEITNFLSNNMQLMTQNEYMRHNISTSETPLTQKSTTQYIRYWKEYLRLEKNEAILNVLDKGALKFSDRKIKVDFIEFIIDDKYDFNLSFEDVGDEFLSYYDAPIYDLLRENDEGSLEKISRSAVTDDVKLELFTPSEIMIGKVKEVNSKSVKVYYNRDFIHKIEKMPLKGYLSLSFMGSKKNFQRKEGILQSLRDKDTSFLKNIILYGSSQGLENTSRRIKRVTTVNTYEDMFGTKEMKPTETQREALKIALTTPDIACIQGPPGTGKTTIIRGVISRLKSVSDYTPKILVSSEQHEALGNVIDGVQTMLPPTVISKKFSETDEDLYSKITEFQEQIKLDFEQVLSREEFKDENGEVLSKLTLLRNEGYSQVENQKIIDEISAFVIGKGQEINRFNKALFRFQNVIRRKRNFSKNYKDDLQEILLDGCRLSKNSFSDDGIERLDEIVTYLSFTENDKYEELSEVKIKLENGYSESVFNEYCKLINDLKNFNRIESSIDGDEDNYKDVLKELFDSFDEYVIITQYSSQSRVLNDTMAEILNPKLLTKTVAKYNSIFGSTCQQSVKFSSGYGPVTDVDSFDYVIIDEASRVNPIDLIIPMTMGNRIILVGDQKQLPHYLERQHVRKLAKNKKVKNEVLDEILCESLFSRIFNLVKNSYLNKETTVKRYITLNEQYRMNSILGKFISDEFYEGEIVNGIGVDAKKNTYNIANSKLIAWYDISKEKGFEVNTNSGSKLRKVEVTHIIELIKQVIDNYAGDLVNIPTIGIMSYYKSQTNAIEKELKNRFVGQVLDNIFVGTVDSFQGKEFDIVFLSTTRSNNEEDLRKRVGFISNSPNRINVSMSRAKNLMVVVGDSQTICGTEDNKVVKQLFNYLALCKEEGYYERLK